MREIWKDIPGYEGHYAASNLGNIKSLKYNKEKIIKPMKNCKGYFICFLSKNNNQKKFKVHQLIAITFLNHTPCGMKLVIDHINDDKSDNSANNLRIVSNRDNCHRVKKGMNTSKYKGVHFDKDKNKWRAQTTINNKRKHIGFYNSEEEAFKSHEEFFVCYHLILLKNLTKVSG